MTQTSPTAATLPPKRPLSVDGVQRRQAIRQSPSRPAPSLPTTAAAPTHATLRRPSAAQVATATIATTSIALPKEQPQPAAQAVRPTRTGVKKQKRQQLYIVLTLLAGGVGGFLIQAVWFGVAAIALYGVLVFIMRIPSRTTFALAGVSIATISSLFLFKPSTELASNFATYTFMLLVIGVISLVRESQSPNVRSLRDRNHRR